MAPSSAATSAASATPDLRQHVERRLSALRSERDGNEWVSHWQDLAAHFLPRRGQALYDRRANKGGRLGATLVDNTGLIAARTLAGGMFSGLSSPTRDWFQLASPDADLNRYGPAKRWLHEVWKVLNQVFHASNLYKQLPTVYADCGVFGTHAMAMLDDYDDVVRFYPLSPGDYHLALSERLSVDTCYRELRLTVAQLVERFGLDAVSHAVRNQYDRGNYDDWVDVGHAVEPNSLCDPDSPFAAKKRYRSVYWETASSRDAVLRLAGFDDFPVLAPAWYRDGTDIYGRSPAMDALGDARQLQMQQRTKAQAIELMVRPPMNAPAALKNLGVSLLPGKVNFHDGVDPGKAMQPVYQVQPRIQELVGDIEDARRRINEAMHSDLFKLVSQLDTVRTAAEIYERREEKALLLGPVVEGQEDDLLAPIIERTFNIMVRHSLPAWVSGQGKAILPPPPPELQGMPLKVEFVSMLAQAQRAVGLASIERTVGFIGNLARLDPSALTKLDMDAAIEEYTEGAGAPPRLIRSAEQVAQLRQAQARQQQQQQALAAGQAMADGAQTLSQTDMGGDNALTRLADVMGKR